MPTVEPEPTLPAPATPSPASSSDGLGAWQRRKVGTLKRAARRAVTPEARRRAGVRRRLAATHLHGAGLEIGPLHQPLYRPRGTSVRYVDRFDVATLREHYPELDGFDLVAPDIIDDGETLATVPDGSVDFVIANHMIEHCEDPIGTIANHLRVLRPGGVLYMAVPDCRFTFDREREITPVEHTARDHAEGPQGSRRGHFEEWARYVDRVPGEDVPRRADELMERNYSIHFHVWTPSAFVRMLSYGQQDLGLPFELEAMERNGHEFIVILRRSA